MRINRDEEKPIILDYLFNAITPMQSNASSPIHRYSNNNVFQNTIHFEPTLFFNDKCLKIKICNFDNKDFKVFNDYNEPYIAFNYSKIKLLNIPETEPSCSKISSTLLLKNDQGLTANFQAICNSSKDPGCISKCYQTLVTANNNKMIEKNLTFVNDGFFNTKTSKHVSSYHQKNVLQSILKQTTSSNLTIEEFYQIRALVKPGFDFFNGSELISSVQNGNGEKLIFVDETTSNAHIFSTDVFSGQHDKSKKLLMYDDGYRLNDKRLVNSNLHQNKLHAIKPIVLTENIIKSSPKQVESANIVTQKLFQDKQPKHLKAKSPLFKSGKVTTINLSKSFVLKCFVKEKCGEKEKAVDLRRSLTSKSKQNIVKKKVGDLSEISKPDCTKNVETKEIKLRKRKYEQISKASVISHSTNNSSWKFNYNQKRTQKSPVYFFGSKTNSKDFSFSFRTNTKKLNTKATQQIHKHESVYDLKVKDNMGVEKNVLPTKAENLFNSSTSIKIISGTNNQDLNKVKSFNSNFKEYKQYKMEPITLVDEHMKHDEKSNKSNGSTIISVQNVPISQISLKPFKSKSEEEISFSYRHHSVRSSASVDELTSCSYFSTKSPLNNSKSNTESALSEIVTVESEETISKLFN